MDKVELRAEVPPASVANVRTLLPVAIGSKLTSLTQILYLVTQHSRDCYRLRPVWPNQASVMCITCPLSSLPTQKMSFNPNWISRAGLTEVMRPKAALVGSATGRLN